ncbi:snare associated Golgi protein-domain-containing protein, partial [Auriculariales sp. MPI-PUGE-AT-0066]
MQSNYQASISDLNLTSQNPYGDAPNSPSRNMPPRGPPGYPPSDPHQQPLGSYDPPATARQRSPSPTPTEILEINRPLYDLTPYKSKKYWLQWRLVPWYIGGIILIAGFTLLTIYHKEVVNYLKPAADWAAGLKFGWLIPIAVLFVISFPPLFGHEIVAVICGLVWGLWVGFGIVCVGTLLGEIGNYYAFLYCCRARAEKMEKEKPYYDCLARVVREGGFKVALMARLSAIPGHFTTAIFATCGMNIFVFTIAAILSLPKQFITVYAGVVLEANSEEKKENKPQNDTDKVTKIISNVVAGFSLFITFFALWWIYREMIKVKPIVFRERRKAR